MKHFNKIKFISSLVVIILLSITSSFAQEKNKKKKRNKEIDEFQLYETDRSVKVQTADKESVEAWKDKRFGMFIHWGPISQLGKQLGHGRNSPSHHPGGKPYKIAKFSAEDYDAQYKTFNPVKYDPDYIVKLAKSTGMEYLVFTAKHHAGFSMWDSKFTDYDMMSTPYKKDILKELEIACKKEDFGFGFYYSPRDWHHPDCDSEFNHHRYVKFYKSQMEELLNNYGKIEEIWFDGLGPGDWGDTSKEVMKRIRTLQPGVMVNDRGGVGADFYTPEHYVGYFNNKSAWETCQTTTGGWGYNPRGKAKKFPQLIEILLYTWGGDGNVLLNVGPRGDGTLNPVEVVALEEVAEWWKLHGEKSVRASRGGPYFPGEWGAATRKKDKIYLHIFRWDESGTMVFPNIQGSKVLSARLLNGKKVKVKKGRKEFSISLDNSDLENVVTTIELSMDGNIMDVEPLLAQKPLTLDAKITSSTNEEDLKNLRDQDAETYWYTKPKVDEAVWVDVEFDSPKTITSVMVGRGDHWNPKQKHKLQTQDENGEWQTVFEWKTKHQPIHFLDTPLTTKKIRLHISKSSKVYIAEYELYGK